MPYKIGRYRTESKKEYDLDALTHEEGEMFLWLMHEYQTTSSWKEFQERTADPIKDFAMKMQRIMEKNGQSLHWEDETVYIVRADLLRNVGIRNGELKGDLSDMILPEEKKTII
ncbi:MAG: hypothetical protein AABX05_00435 [Nanoarchaeota archaeon]